MKTYVATSLFVPVLLLAAVSHAQLTIELTVPDTTPADATVYVAGSFNDWDPGSSDYTLVALSEELHTITLPESVRGIVSFKFTLGSWETVELDEDGADVPNRVALIPETGAATYSGTVAAWREDTWPLPDSTATPSVSILATDFEMPQLGRTRRVWLYLPPDYETSGKRYPVLYMQDGQNVFDAATSAFGEWEVDESLDDLHAQGDWGVIVVAVDHGEANRANEYHPWPHPDYGGGEGDEYMDFLAQTLKPFIDAQYRTLSNRRNTGIGGSSSGGLISYYGPIRYPEVFGRVLSFSPAFFANPEIFDATLASTPLEPPSRFTFVSDLTEGDPPGIFADSQMEMVNTLAAAGYDVASDVRSRIPDDGAHSEWFWAREFPDAYRWLFDSEADADADEVPDFADNCTEAANPDQRDSDADGFGNVCDADLDNDCTISYGDLGIIQSVFFTTDPHADLDGDGVVNFADLGTMRTGFYGAPGPSGTTGDCGA